MEKHKRENSLETEEQFTKVEIYLSCRNIAVSCVSVRAFLEDGGKLRQKVYESKPTTIQGDKTDFADSLILDYFFQRRQKIFLQIIDVSKVETQQIGKVETTVGQIFTGRAKGIVKQVAKQGHSLGQLLLRCDKVETGCKKFVEFDLQIHDLEVRPSCCLFNFFARQQGPIKWRLYKIKSNNQLLLYESEAKQGKTCRYNHLKINLSKLCNNDSEQPVILRVYENDKNLLGEIRLKFASLHQNMLSYSLKQQGKEKKRIYFQNYKETIKYEFPDYLSSGMQIAMVLCIDFTASNKLQNDPHSLHYHKPGKMSQYQEALHEFSSIVLDYDTDKLVPCYGFGAKVNMPNFNTNNRVDHCFPINGSKEDPNLFKLDGIQQGYRNCLQYLHFSGPTYFAPLLREAMDDCKRMKLQQKEYMILLILTDGAIHDEDQVKNLLISCSRLPLSIIIVGIGDGDGGKNWQAMHRIDDNDMEMQDAQGNKTERDLVQFTVFEQFKNNGVDLASQVLYELPRQVEEYHMLCGLTPDIYKKGDLDIQRQRAERK